MGTTKVTEVFPCPECGVGLFDSGIAIMESVIPAEKHFSGKAHLELSICCQDCETHVYTYIAYSELCDADGDALPAPREAAP